VRGVHHGRIAAFVLNRTRVRDPRRVTACCRDAARASNWAPLLLGTTRDDAGAGLAGDALAAGAGLVIAVGGDGTVRACAQALAGTGVPLAIVPMGTANLTARALGVPPELGAALATGFGGHERRIDLAAADGVSYAAMAGIGVDAAVVGGTPGGLKARAGWLAYVAAGAWHALGPRAVFLIRLDGAARPLIRRARSVVVGNAGLLPGGFGLLPDARLDDGLLDVAILGPASPLGWARVGYRIMTGSRHEDRRLERHRARRVEIYAGIELPREADGEVIPPGRSLTVTVSPGALLVRVPSQR
jgi:diacylglycerol kinase family enzyme